MKKLLYIAAACSSLSLFSAVDEKLSMENLMQGYMQAKAQMMFMEALLIIRDAQDTACSIHATFEQIKNQLVERFARYKNIPNNNSQESYMLRQELELIQEAVKLVAEATRKNELPAVDSQIFKKGVDAQAMRLKVIEYIESLLK